MGFIKDYTAVTCPLLSVLFAAFALFPGLDRPLLLRSSSQDFLTRPRRRKTEHPGLNRPRAPVISEEDIIVVPSGLVAVSSQMHRRRNPRSLFTLDMSSLTQSTEAQRWVDHFFHQSSLRLAFQFLSSSSKSHGLATLKSSQYVTRRGDWALSARSLTDSTASRRTSIHEWDGVRRKFSENDLDLAFSPIRTE